MGEYERQRKRACFYPGCIDRSKHIREPLLTEVQQNNQIEAAADEFIIFWLWSKKKKIYN